MNIVSRHITDQIEIVFAQYIFEVGIVLGIGMGAQGLLGEMGDEVANVDGGMTGAE